MSETTSNYFSIIIPLYNKTEYLERAIQSILNQTYQNFEIIVVNDGSTDGGVHKVESYPDARIVLINQTNQGVSVARNNGVNQAKYAYVAFLDADDEWETSFLNELNNLVNLHPNAGIYGINHFYQYKNGRITYQNYNWLFNGRKNGLIPDYFEIFSKLGKSPFSNSGCCFPIDVFNNIGGYKAGVKITEDSDLWCRIALTHKIAFHIEPLLTYFLETPENTRSILEFQDFQVSATLQNSLRNGEVPEKFIKSVKKLIAFQQLSLVKRAILTGNNIFAINKLMNLGLISNYPINSILHFCYAIIPHRLFVSIRKSLKLFNK